mmetsp:Transcript_167520/g.537949  ORF Transcript_167520/g.537949 Transcript_167520/m.537949 type:complete len:190 (-) Transcript_167520:132-701(-)
MGAAASNATGLSDKGAHEVRVASTEILKVAGLSGFHTSIIVDDREFFFDREGIMSAPPLWSHLAGRAKHTEAVRTEISDAGRSSMGGRALVQALQPFFEKGSYDIFFKNCNSFTDVALFFMTRQRLDCRFTRIERFVMATNPVSTSLLNRLFRAFLENNTGQAGSLSKPRENYGQKDRIVFLSLCSQHG